MLGPDDSFSSEDDDRIGFLWVVDDQKAGGPGREEDKNNQQRNEESKKTHLSAWYYSEIAPISITVVISVRRWRMLRRGKMEEWRGTSHVGPTANRL